MTIPSAEDLGYEEVMPSAADLCYESNDESPSAAELGYDDDEPPTAGELGYGEEGTPPPSDDGVTQPEQAEPPQLSARRRLRRSSWRNSVGCTMGGMEMEMEPVMDPRSPTTTNATRCRPPRRVTMHHCPFIPTPLSVPSHHTRAPRRSSMSSMRTYGGQECISTTGYPHKAQRRVSFGGSDDVNHVPRLHNDTLEDKKKMWYDISELNNMRHTIRQLIQQEVEFDETQDSWRGLERYVRKQQMKSRPSSLEPDDDDAINQLLQHFQQQLAASSFASNDENNCPRPESRNPPPPLRLRTDSNRRASQDAADALEIYMETMDSEQVRACFPTLAYEA